MSDDQHTASRFSLRQLWLAPNLLSLARLPLAALFPLVVDHPSLAMAVLLMAGLTDAADGWLARRSGNVSVTGAIVDPIADKLFALAVLITLLVHQMLPPWGIPLLMTREIFELPLVIWISFGKRFRGTRLVGTRANIPGKVATIIQFAAVLSAIALPAALQIMLIITAVAGFAAGVSYWVRQLRRANILQ